jgi:integrase
LPDGRRTFRSTGQSNRKKAQDVCRTLERTSEKARAGELSRSTARKLLDNLLENIGAEPLSTQTAHSFFAAWLSGKEISVKPGVYKLYQKTITRFLTHLGDKAFKSLSDVTPADVTAFRDARLKAEGVSVGTFILDLKALRCVFNLARRQGLVSHSPADAIDLPPLRRIERDVFDATEIQALLSKAPSPQWRVVILVGYYCGARLSDAVSLRWDNVELTPPNSLIRFVQGKTNAVVVIPIHQDLEMALLELAGTDNPHGLICPGLAKTPVGGRFGLSDQFSRLMETVGIDRQAVQGAKRKVSRKSFHSLRHSFASALANAGVSADVRMRLTGHKSFDIHQRYSHLEIESLRAGIAVLPSLGTLSHRS